MQSEEKHKMEEPNPFVSEDEVGEVASVAYRYRKWDLDGGIVLVARCEHDSVTTGSSSNEHQFINIKALNEWDSRVSFPSTARSFSEKLHSNFILLKLNILRNHLRFITLSSVTCARDYSKFKSLDV